ncbi:MAG: Glutamate racemase (EC [Candidatus Burkholderia crenata]|nr:MAG: Glutamate racemase (EC [Candidatus Burkholderia crenata]
MLFDALRSSSSSAVSVGASHEAPGSAAPIGIFDSGVGGLSVLRAVRAALPDERLIYAADSLYAPYGERDDDFIADRTLAICEWLISQGAKALVVACNTATSQSIAQTRERLAVPVIGVEPGIKPAALTSQTRVVGVLATAVTLRSARFHALAERHTGDCRFILRPGHGLVQAVERCDTDSPELLALLRSYVQPMLDASADTLVLGCTHYPFLDETIRSIAGDRLTLVDTSVAIARQLERQLDSFGLRAVLAQVQDQTQAQAIELPRFYSTNDGQALRKLAASLLGLDVVVEHVVIPSRRTLGLESDPV